MDKNRAIKIFLLTIAGSIIVSTTYVSLALWQDIIRINNGIAGIAIKPPVPPIPPKGLNETLPKAINFKIIEAKNPNWETFRNENYGFEVDFPSGWKIETDYHYFSSSDDLETRDNSFPDIYDISFYSKNNNDESVVISISSKPLEKSLDGYRKTYRFIKEENVRINNLDAIKITNLIYSKDVDPGSWYTSYLFEYNEFVYALIDIAGDAKFNDVLASFRFLD